MKKLLTLAVAAVIGITAMSLTACSDKKDFQKMKLKDGTYTGTYTSEDGMKATTEVKITIKDGKITAAERVEKDAKGEVKDENYGKEAGDTNFAIAQKSVKGASTYATKLVEVQDPDLVDSVSGATVSYKSFKAAVWDALSKAE
ncbi:FMN-binding domain-containing protein [Mageeibacillus indolicus]|uniref:FMN-binding domain-containing protein n=1 Tax=Mageeibacillus indolicus TaxID=884684 RepID=A0A2J8B2C1_9FIRM|nr:FMN-binding protein [Mageeibacillus indolicus]PNH18896.1 FMN-binding domain-containing protein [Mageeibacillus indolicus]